MVLEMKIHGTYPHDSGHWISEKEITRDEAADLTNAPKELREMKYSNGAQKYLWLNKGFIVLGMSEGSAIPGMGLAMAEQFFNPEAKGIPFGAHAVYIGDGQYYLLKYIGKEGRKAIDALCEARNEYNNHRNAHGCKEKCDEDKNGTWDKFVSAQKTVDEIYAKL